MFTPKGRDLQREFAEQEAFQDAERLRAERRAGVLVDGLVDASPTGIELYEVDGRPVKSNKAAERLLGKVPPPGINLFDERGLKRTGLLEPQLKRVLAGARVETPPYWYDPTDIGLPGIPGRRVCCRATVCPLFDAEGKVCRIAVFHEDVTELKKLEEQLKEAREAVRAAPAPGPEEPPPAGADARDVEFARRKVEQALRESEERYRAVVESARGYTVIRLAEDGRILALSPSISDFTGISRDATMTDNSLLFAQVHPDDLARFREAEAQARKLGEYPAGNRFRMTHKTSNAVCWVELRGSAVTFASRRTFELLLLDVTAWKQTEELLSEKETGIARLLASDTEPFLMLDKDWIITAWGPAVARETRFEAKEAVGKRLWEVFPDLEKSGFALTFRKTLLDKEPQYKEGFYTDGRDKHAGWYAVSTWPFGAGVIAVVRNVTQRKKIEQAWQDADSRLRALLDNPTVLVAFKDRDLRYVAANTAAKKLLGAAAAGEMVGKTDAELFPATVTGLLGTHDRHVLDKGEPVTVELALGDPKNDSTIWLNLSKQPWLTAGGDVQGVVDVGFDITRGAKSKQELTRRRDYLEKLLKEHNDALGRARDELARWLK